MFAIETMLPMFAPLLHSLRCSTKAGKREQTAR